MLAFMKGAQPPTLKITLPPLKFAKLSK